METDYPGARCVLCVVAMPDSHGARTVIREAAITWSNVS
jgi:hypothetical protein